MTLPRPVLIALLGVALCAAAFLATRSASDTGSAVTTVTPDQQATPVHHAAKPAAPAHAANSANKAKAHKAAPAAQDPTVDKSHAAAAAPTQPKPATPAKPAN